MTPEEILQAQLDLDDLKQLRAIKRSKNSKLHTQVADLVDSLCDADLLADWYATFKKNFDALKDAEQEIIDLSAKLGQSYDDVDKSRHKKYLDQARQALDRIEQRQIYLHNNQSQATSGAQVSGMQNAQILNIAKEMCKQVVTQMSFQSQPKPVELRLEEFYPDKKGASFQHFIFSLEQYFSKYPHFSDSIKLQYLMQQMRGRAADFVTRLPTVSATYDELKSKIEKAFCNKIKERDDVIKALINIKYTDSADFYSELHAIVSIMKNLNATLDDLQRYFAWRCLPLHIRNKLVNATSNSDPSLNEIFDNIHSAHHASNQDRELYKEEKINKGRDYKERDNKNYRSNAKKDNVTAFATNVQADATSTKPKKATNKNVNKGLQNNNKSEGNKHNYSRGALGKKPLCPLCAKDGKEANHFLSVCKVYETVPARIKRIRELNGCERCSFTNHETKSCKIPNMKCQNCQEAHNVSLCPKINVKSEAVSAQNNASAGVAVCAQGNTPYGSLLPSLSVNVMGYNVHTLVDTGCQNSFIKEQIIHDKNLEIIEQNIPLTINGVNSNKVYVTKKVKVPIKINNITHYLYCLTLPEIDLNINVPGIENLVKLFTSFGCTLADKTLENINSNKIAEFEMILGINDFHILNIKPSYLGNMCFWDVASESILFGNVEKMVDDLESLKLHLSNE